MSSKPQDRNREADLDTLATAVLRMADRRNDGEGNGWGIDDKRPFGFSGDLAGQLLEAIGVTCADTGEADNEERPEAWDTYALELYDDLGKHIRDGWAALMAHKKDGEP